MEGSIDEYGAPESWEVADLEESVKRILLKDVKPPAVVTESLGTSNFAPTSSSELPSSSGSDEKGDSFFERAVNQVDQFLREALQNPRERLSVLRMERDVEKFIRDPTQQQLEFQQLPTSYLRLAAHRVAQHYSLQSMVLLDNNSDEGSGSKIIIRKTSECQLPAVRLADIPISMPGDDADVIKVAIKQRPQQHLQSSFQSTTSKSLKESFPKTVEERKEEYNKARARIFNSASCSNNSSGKPENQARLLDGYRHGAMRVEEKPVIGSDPIRRPVDCAMPLAVRPARIRAERDPVPRWRPNGRVAIFRDREVDKQDPDYDRSYERYMQRFDPGFGFSGGPYPIQPMYSPAVNYNTEFPQLGSSRRPQACLERQSAPLPQHAHSPWAAVACGYTHPESVVPPFNSASHVAALSTSSMFMHSSQHACQRPAMPFMYSMEHLQQQPFMQSRQQQEMSFGIARPR